MYRLPLLLSAFFLTACVSDFNRRDNAFLRKETEATLAQKIIKGKTTHSEIEAQFGRPSRYYGGCYGYDTSSVPLYNFLPTNFFYMKSRSDQWRLCIDYDGDTVRGYRFSHKIETDVDSPAGSLLKDISDGLKNPSSKENKENPQ